MSYPEKTRSNAWFLLPILFGIIGGIITFFIFLRNDLKKAIYCLIIGAISSFLALYLNFSLLENISNSGFNVNI